MTAQPAFRAVDDATWGDATWPLGAHLAGDDAATFAVYSKHATRIVLELYERAIGQDAVASYEMRRNAADDIWRAKVRGAAHGTLYAFRCWGPNWPYSPEWSRGNCAAGFLADWDSQGNRYDPNKVLFDPYARELSHERTTAELLAAGHDDRIYGWGGVAYRGTPRRLVDTGRWAPKGVVVDDATPTGTRPRTRGEDTAIYEAHVRNLTSHPSASHLRSTLAAITGFEGVRDVPPEYRGTFAGAGMMAPYVKALGFTAIELLPVQESDHGPETAGVPTLNHWGYMTLGFYAPDRHYARDRSYGGPTREFKEMVRAFHDCGIEVYLDVVFNHTAEGGGWIDDRDGVGFVSFGGIDTTEYYVLSPSHRLVGDATGCGNQLNCSTPVAQGLICDALRYWIGVMGVDGFRFDLAPVLGRSPNACERHDWQRQRTFHPQHSLLREIACLGAEAEVELIAEAWDLWGYEVGNFPSGWAEWNGRFRDAVREYLKGDACCGAFMSMMNGDYEHFSDQGGAHKSVNFVTAHDGFTLTDLVSYNARNNGEPPPFGPSEGGSDDNRSWDSGGDHALRRQRMRNFWTVLFFSRGMPLALSGDEFGKTQNGNNNPYALNVSALWNNYAMAASPSPTAVPVDPTDPAVRYHDNLGRAIGPDGVNPYFRFAAFVANLRRRHSALRQRAWGDFVPDNADVSYLFTRPDGLTGPEPYDRCVRLHIDGSGIGDHDFLILVNMYTDEIAFTVPAAAPGGTWVRIIDTAAWAEAACNCWDEEHADDIVGDYRVHPWSIVVLEEVRERSAHRRRR